MAEVAQQMVDAGISHIPVHKGGLVVGTNSIRDVLALELWGPPRPPLSRQNPSTDGGVDEQHPQGTRQRRGRRGCEEAAERPCPDESDGASLVSEVSTERGRRSP